MASSSEDTPGLAESTGPEESAASAEPTDSTQSDPDHDPDPEPIAARSRFRPLRRTTVALSASAAAVALVAGTGGYAIGAAVSSGSSIDTAGAADSDAPEISWPDGLPWPGGRGFEGSAPEGRAPEGWRDADRGGSVVPATGEQLSGVVTIDTELSYGIGRSAGTGIVLTSTGFVLTNHHVVDGATEVVVTVESTGRSYDASFVGSDPENDIALLVLDGARGLETAELDESDDLMIGDAVASIGNAGGTGDLVVAEGEVVDLESQITIGDSGESRRLDGLIEFDAHVVGGDSGGPLVDADGDVVGVVTAASRGGREIAGFAVPIDDAMAIVRQIESGRESGTVQLGLPAFLGVMLSDRSAGTGARIDGSFDGSPAAEAGLDAGFTIVQVDDSSIVDGDDLRDAIRSFEPGDRVTITYLDSDGEEHDASVTLTAGPIG